MGGPSRCLQPDQDSTGRFPRLAPPYKISVILLRSATRRFGCSTNVNESFPLIAAALDEDLRLEIDAPAFDIVRYVIAVLLGCQPSCCPFAGVDTQPSHVAILLCGSVSNLNAFLEEFVRLLLARARIGRESRRSRPTTDKPATYPADRAANRFGGLTGLERAVRRTALPIRGCTWLDGQSWRELLLMGSWSVAAYL